MLISTYNLLGEIDVSFKLQLEKGNTATPYQVSTDGPYSDVDLGQFGLTTNQIQTYYDLYLEAVRFENENIEASQDLGGYQSIFKSILIGVSDLMRSMDGLWDFLNAPLLEPYMHPINLNIDWSWDLVNVIRQILDLSGKLFLNLFFIVPFLWGEILNISVHVSILTLLFSNIIFVVLGWIVVKSFIL